MKKFINNKEVIITSGVIIICLFLYGIFPTSDLFQKIVSTLTFLLVIPALYIKITLRKDLKDFGLRKGDWKKGLIWTLLSFLGSLLIFYIVFQYTDFSEKYQLPKKVTEEFKIFLAYELLLVGFFTVLYEFFFRGLVMFSFSKKIKGWAIILQALLFILFLALTNTFDWPMIPYAIFSLFAGIIAYKSDSLAYSFGASLLFTIIIDTITIKFLK